MGDKTKIEKIIYDELKQIIANSENAYEALKQVGYIYPNSNYVKKLFQKCDEWNINYQHLYFNIGKEQPCINCGQTKPLTEFYSKRIVCKECVKAKEKEKYRQRKQQVNNYKKKQRCAKCGDNRYYVLDFHHINAEDKEYNISENSRIKFENLKKELDKCIVLCSNCHREFHFLKYKDGLTLDEYLNLSN